MTTEQTKKIDQDEYKVKLLQMEADFKSIANQVYKNTFEKDFTRLAIQLNSKINEVLNYKDDLLIYKDKLLKEFKEISETAVAKLNVKLGRIEKLENDVAQIKLQSKEHLLRQMLKELEKGA